MRILVVDDDPAISEMLSILLESEGYTPVTCDTGDGALALFRAHHPSLVLLDLMLPGIDGVEVCRQIRRLSDVPVIMLTARTDTEDVVAGLEAGADDYVTKPFQTTELLARVRARLRHLSAAVTPEVLRAGDLDIDVAAHRVLRGAQTIAVTPLEFDLLTTLARSPWKAFTREELLDAVWGYQHGADTRLVNVHVQRLRSKVQPDPERPRIVVTVRGVGYRIGDAV